MPSDNPTQRLIQSETHAGALVLQIPVVLALKTPLTHDDMHALLEPDMILCRAISSALKAKLGQEGDKATCLVGNICYPEDVIHRVAAMSLMLGQATIPVMTKEERTQYAVDFVKAYYEPHVAASILAEEYLVRAQSVTIQQDAEGRVTRVVDAATNEAVPFVIEPAKTQTDDNEE